MLGNWLAGVNAYAHPHTLKRFSVVLLKATLNVCGGAHGIRYLIESGQDPVAGVLHLAPGMQREAASDKGIMQPHQFERCGVAEAAREFG
jgi:hypothetical protein